jgi:hypothetical protein
VKGIHASGDPFGGNDEHQRGEKGDVRSIGMIGRLSSPSGDSRWHDRPRRHAVAGPQSAIATRRSALGRPPPGEAEGHNRKICPATTGLLVSSHARE